MSVMSKPMRSSKRSDRKNGLSIGDITKPTGITVGRGFEENINSPANRTQDNANALIGEAGGPVPTEAELDTIIAQSNLPPNRKELLKTTLHKKILTEMRKGDEANTMVVKEELTKISTAVPALRQPLKLFIENHIDVSTTVKYIMASLLKQSE